MDSIVFEFVEGVEEDVGSFGDVFELGEDGVSERRVGVGGEEKGGDVAGGEWWEAGQGNGWIRVVGRWEGREGVIIVIVNGEDGAGLNPKNGAGDIEVAGDVKNPRDERVVDDEGDGVAVGGLAAEEGGERGGADGVEVMTEGGDVYRRVKELGAVGEEGEAEVAGADGGGDAGESGGGGLDLLAGGDGGGEGDKKAGGGHALGETEEWVQVTLAREGDEEDVWRVLFLAHAG